MEVDAVEPSLATGGGAPEHVKASPQEFSHRTHVCVGRVGAVTYLFLNAFEIGEAHVEKTFLGQWNGRRVGIVFGVFFLRFPAFAFLFFRLHNGIADDSSFHQRRQFFVESHRVFVLVGSRDGGQFYRRLGIPIHPCRESMSVLFRWSFRMHTAKS